MSWAPGAVVMCGTVEPPATPDDLAELAARFPGWQFCDYAAGAGRRMLVARRGSVELVAAGVAALAAAVEAEQAAP